MPPHSNPRITGQDILIALALAGAGYLAYRIVRSMIEESKRQRQEKLQIEQEK